MTASPQEMGVVVLARLDLSGDERVLDVGCGSGRITETLAERVRHGHVIAVDESASMAAAARTRLGPAVEVRVADVLELELDEPVDAILSTATFHWISDHERLFAKLHGLLRPGGRLVAQCGGESNIAGLRGRASVVAAREPYAEHLRGWRPPWNYADPEVTRRRLLAAGFTTADCALQPYPVQPAEPREFLATIVLEPHVRQLPEGLREAFMDEVMAELGEPVVVDYVRLNIDALA